MSTARIPRSLEETHSQRVPGTVRSTREKILDPSTLVDTKAQSQSGCKAAPVTVYQVCCHGTICPVRLDGQHSRSPPGLAKLLELMFVSVHPCRP